MSTNKNELLNQEEEKLTEKGKELLEEAFNNRECSSCSHFSVCQIYRNFKRNLAGEYAPETKNSRNNDCPISAEDLAKICDMYLVGGR